MKIEYSGEINAPVDEVFAFVSNPPEMAKAFPDQVTKLEVLSENSTGVGSRFREFRKLGKKDDVLELETTEFILNERVLTKALTAGSLWFTGFDVGPAGEGSTRLTISMEAQPQNIFARIMNLMMKPMLHKSGKAEFEKVKDHLERAT